MADELVERVRSAMQRQLVHAVLDNERVAREHGLLVTDLQALHLLVLRQDVRTPSQISAATSMPASTVTKLVDRLEAAGFVRRSSDPSDRRRTVVDLVPDAIGPLRTLYERADEHFDDLSRQFTQGELDTVVRYLDAVSDFYALR